MTIPVFDIDYQSAYSTTVEFLTKINEKHLGFEQRYPVWTYPKRVFSLKFDKNFEQRKRLEDFFISVNGAQGKFYFDWREEKGGNNKRYLCSFDEESFKMKIQDFGYTECELNLVCIDDNPVEHCENLDFWHDAECDYSITYKTITDAIFTARNDKKIYWQSPKRKWTLHFEKDSNIRQKAEKFFISKHGKFKSFLWIWSKDKGGDGKTYRVRFDSDKLDLSVFDYGFGKFSMNIIEVFSSENPLSELEKDEIIPRKLLKIDIDGGSVCILDNETLESLEYNGITYLGAPLKHSEIVNDDNSAVNKMNIELSNVSLAISSIIGNRGDIITNAPAVLTLVFLNINTNEIIPDFQKILYCGKCNNLSLDFEKASIDIETDLGGYEKIAPVIKYRPSCQVRRFKDCRCGYKGSETSCDRTFTRCLELGNTSNFRGFPSCVLQTVIKA